MYHAGEAGLIICRHRHRLIARQIHVRLASVAEPDGVCGQVDVQAEVGAAVLVQGAQRKLLAILLNEDGVPARLGLVTKGNLQAGRAGWGRSQLVELPSCAGSRLRKYCRGEMDSLRASTLPRQPRCQEPRLGVPAEPQLACVKCTLVMKSSLKAGDTSAAAPACNQL